CRQADMAAQDAIRDGRSIELEPMGSNERRVVHEHLRERPEVETFSEGDEPHRFVVVAPLLAD
ncbi:MAG: protein jag, partial [Actinomycetota bacterium]|nr:protein jag [Actinomycetota bacterium]